MCGLYIFVLCAFGFAVHVDGQKLKFTGVTATAVPPIHGYELKFVHVAMRIAEHTPSDRFLNAFSTMSKLTLKDFKPYGYNELLPNGKRHMYRNGLNLWSRYSKLLGDDANKTEIRSLDFNAAKHGMLIALEGLKAEASVSEDDVVNRTFTKTELNKPYENKDLIDDITRVVTQSGCIAYFKGMRKVLEEEEQKLMKTYENRLKNVLEKFTIDYPYGLFLLYELYRMFSKVGNNLPEWYLKDQKALKSLSTKVLNSEFSNTELIRLSGGRYITNLLEEVEQIKNGTHTPSDSKMVMFGGSAPFLRAIIAALGGGSGYKDLSKFTEQYPEYGAMLVIEVYAKNDDGTYHLRVYYRNKADTEYEMLFIEKCPDLCELKKLKEILRPVLITKDEADKECNNIK